MYNQRDSQQRPGQRPEWERQRGQGSRERGYEPQSMRGLGTGLYESDEEEFGQNREDFRLGESGDSRRQERGSSGFESGRSGDFGNQGYRSRMETGGTSGWDDSNWGDRGYGSLMGRGGYQSSGRGNIDQQGNPQRWNLGGYASPRGSSGFEQQDSGQQNWGTGSWQRSGQQFGQSRGMHVGRGPKGYRRSDERILEDVNETLSQHPYLDASEIEVKVQNGEVTLTGTVTERQDKRLAEDIVEQCSGVKDVRNEIRVQPQGSGQQSTGQSGTQQAQKPEGSPMHQGINAGSTVGLSGSKPEGSR